LSLDVEGRAALVDGDIGAGRLAVAAPLKPDAPVRAVVLSVEIALSLAYTTSWIVVAALLRQHALALKSPERPEVFDPRSLLHASVGLQVVRDNVAEYAWVQPWARVITVVAGAWLVLLAVIGLPRILLVRSATLARVLLACSVLGAPLALAAVLADSGGENLLAERVNPWWTFTVDGLAAGLPGPWMVATVLAALLFAWASVGRARAVSGGAAMLLFGATLLNLRASGSTIVSRGFLPDHADGLFTLVTALWLIALCLLALRAMARSDARPERVGGQTAANQPV
jgi:hypothetical protein